MVGSRWTWGCRARLWAPARAFSEGETTSKACIPPHSARTESTLGVKALGLEAATALARKHEAGKVALLVAGMASAALPVLESVGRATGEDEEEGLAACCSLLSALTCADDDTLPSSRRVYGPWGGYCLCVCVCVCGGEAMLILAQRCRLCCWGTASLLKCMVPLAQ